MTTTFRARTNMQNEQTTKFWRENGNEKDCDVVKHKEKNEENLKFKCDFPSFQLFKNVLKII